MPPPSGVPAAREDVDWRFVEPRVGCAIVNVADSLQRATEGQLMSCLHRVGQPAPVPEPSEQDRVACCTTCVRAKCQQRAERMGRMGIRDENVRKSYRESGDMEKVFRS
jgi:hypothetical protein